MNKHLPLGLVVLMSCSLGDYELGPLPPSLECSPGATQQCDTSYDGICKFGSQTCLQTGKWGACIPNTLPGKEAEQCDGLDNNCNGQVDEGFYWKDPNTSVNIPVGQKCCTGKGVCCGTEELVMCAGTTAVCAGTAILPDETWHTDKKNDSFDWNCNGKIEFGATNGSGIYKCVTHCEQISSDGECKSAVQHYSCDDIKKCGTMTSYGNSAYCRWDATNKTCSGSGTSSLEIICK